MTTEEQLIEVIRTKLAGGAGYSELHAVLVEFRDAGGLQEVAYRALERVRASVDEELEDPVLDVMDAVVGWCSPHQKIWSRYLQI